MQTFLDCWFVVSHLRNSTYLGFFLLPSSNQSICQSWSGISCGQLGIIEASIYKVSNTRIHSKFNGWRVPEIETDFKTKSSTFIQLTWITLIIYDPYGNYLTDFNLHIP